jgi:prepilin-type N-terminal cleavage/methylation domain-containing protein
MKKIVKRMKKIKKGFTLIELLAAIVILAIILIIAIPNIMKVIDNVKIQKYKTDEKIIQQATSKYVITNPSKLPMQVGDKTVVTLKELQDEKYLNEIKSVDNNSSYNGYVVITKTNNNTYTYDTYISSVSSTGNINYITVNYNIQNANAYTPFKKSFGGTYDEYFKKVRVINDGYATVGSSSSEDIDMAGLNKGQEDAIIVKYNNTNGNIVWKKSFGGTDYDRFYDVNGLSDNNLIVVGYSASTDGDLSGLNNGVDDAIIVKYDNSGNVVWKKNFGGTSYDVYNGVASLGDNYIAVGSSYSSDMDLTGLNKGEEDAIIVKYDNNGNVLWKKNYGGTVAERYNSVAISDTGYVAVGSSNSTNGDLSGLSKGDSDAIIVKYDENGNILWKKNFGGTSSDSYNSVVTTSGGYVAVGSSMSTNGDLSGLNKGYQDGIIVKYDENGNIIWKKTYGGSSYDHYYDIANITNGYMVVGGSESTDGDLTGLNKGEWDATLVKYDESGNVVSKKNFGGTSSESIEGIAGSPNGYIGVGNYYSNDGDLVGLNKGEWDALITVDNY